MNSVDIFVSVGGTCTDEQELFVSTVEDRLRSEGLVPHTVGRNTFSSDAPLKTVTKLMEKCSGTVVIALERMYFTEGLDKRGGKEENLLKNIKLSTPWNQIEAAIAYTHGHPLVVIVEEGLKNDGLLERGYDWYVQIVKPEPAALNTLEFNGVLADWKSKVIEGQGKTQESKKQTGVSPANLTIGDIIKDLKPQQLWSFLVLFASALAGAFALGAKIITIP